MILELFGSMASILSFLMTPFTWIWGTIDREDEPY